MTFEPGNSFFLSYIKEETTKTLLPQTFLVDIYLFVFFQNAFQTCMFTMNMQCPQES